MPKRAPSNRSTTQKPADRDVLPPEVDGPATNLFFNRELSWLAFNNRVLQLAEDASEPLLERLKFCAIYARNLDEFFMIRVARLHEQVRTRGVRLVPDGADPRETLDTLHERIHEQGQRHNDCFERQLRPALAEKNLRILSMKELEPRAREKLDQRFREQIFPVLTPLAIGLGRHFPYISNLSLSLVVLLRDPETEEENVARVKVPKELLPRFVPVEGTTSFVPLEEIIAHHLGDLFPGMEVLDHGLFRVTRDADYTVSQDAEDLLVAVQTELRERRFGEVIRLELQAGMNPKLSEPLVEALGLEPRHIYETHALLDLADLMALVAIPGFSELRDPSWTPVTQPRLRPDGETEGRTVMAAMRRGPLLVHHPYESFSTSVERFVTEAVEDPDVLALKQTVYRTSDSSPLVPALIRATEGGKQAVCMVELKARFDERTNIQWALKLEEAGVHVVYGIPGMKTHSKAILIVRREGGKARHYVHIGTGNYNPKTARLYTDLGLFTTDPDIGADVADLFNFLTGFARPASFRKLLVAPLNMRAGLLDEIRRTAAAHSAEHPTRIQLKMNALVDPEMIRALYEASRAGVRVELNVRGICCLRPGVPGLSENIRVVSTLGRFLEHSRIYLFDRGTEVRCFIGSADLMPRNLDHRVETLAPVEEPPLVAQVRDLLDRSLADNTHAWELEVDGKWRRLTPKGDKRWAQGELMERAVRMAQGASGRPPP